MYKHGKRDNNHKCILLRLRLKHCAVFDMADLGGGVPDLLVSKDGQNHLIEIKNTKGVLTGAQKKFSERWDAPIYIVRTIEDVDNLPFLRGNNHAIEI